MLSTATDQGIDCPLMRGTMTYLGSATQFCLPSWTPPRPSDFIHHLKGQDGHVLAELVKHTMIQTFSSSQEVMCLISPLAASFFTGWTSVTWLAESNNSHGLAAQPLCGSINLTDGFRRPQRH